MGNWYCYMAYKLGISVLYWLHITIWVQPTNIQLCATESHVGRDIKKKKAERCYIKTVCFTMGLFFLGLSEKTEKDSHSSDQFSWKYVGSVG